MPTPPTPTGAGMLLSMLGIALVKTPTTIVAPTTRLTAIYYPAETSGADFIVVANRLPVDQGGRRRQRRLAAQPSAGWSPHSNRSPSARRLEWLVPASMSSGNNPTSRASTSTRCRCRDTARSRRVLRGLLHASAVALYHDVIVQKPRISPRVVRFYVESEPHRSPRPPPKEPRAFASDAVVLKFSSCPRCCHAASGPADQRCHTFPRSSCFLQNPWRTEDRRRSAGIDLISSAAGRCWELHCTSRGL